ncbi:cytochrome P450, partial [Oryctes borbonicus]
MVDGARIRSATALVLLSQLSMRPGRYHDVVPSLSASPTRRVTQMQDSKNLSKEKYLKKTLKNNICTGMRFAMIQSKLALALLLKNFTFTLSPNTPLPLEMETK